MSCSCWSFCMSSGWDCHAVIKYSPIQWLDGNMKTTNKAYIRDHNNTDVCWMNEWTKSWLMAPPRVEVRKTPWEYSKWGCSRLFLASSWVTWLKILGLVLPSSLTLFFLLFVCLFLLVMQVIHIAPSLSLEVTLFLDLYEYFWNSFHVLQKYMCVYIYVCLYYRSTCINVYTKIYSIVITLYASACYLFSFLNGNNMSSKTLQCYCV